MQAEQINLDLIKELIKKAKSLKNEVVSLTSKLNDIETENSILSDKVVVSNKSNENEVGNLKSTHQSKINELNAKIVEQSDEFLKSKHKELGELKATFEQQIQDINKSHEIKLSGLTTPLTEEIASLKQSRQSIETALSDEVKQLQVSNKAMLDRIRGIK